MSSISELYARFRQLIHEGFKFVVIGAIGAIITFGVANALHPVGPYKAITIATILATVFTYLGNRYWSFRHREGKGHARDSILFFVLNAVGLLIYWGCIGIIDLAGLRKDLVWYNIALVVGTGLGTLFRFWSYRRWIWHDRADAAAPETDEQRAQDAAAMVGAVPVSHHSQNGSSAAERSGQRPLVHGPATNWTPARESSANGASANGSSADGAQVEGATADASPVDATTADGASASGDSRKRALAVSGPHSHARPGRPSLRPVTRYQPDQGRRPPASHRRTS